MIDVVKTQAHLPAARRGLRGHVAAAALGLVLLGGGSMPAAAQDQPNGATIQWAQQILDDKGFYNGRATGRMDAATATAISNYQKSVGLKATGRLDQATIDKLLAERQSAEPPKTMGNLADPTSRARPSAPRLKEEDVIPQAAPATRGVEVIGSGQTPPQPDRFRGAGAASAPPAVTGATGSDPGAPAGAGTAQQPQPEAAARSAVEVEGGGPLVPEPAFDIRNLTAPTWVRYGLIGLVVALVLGVVAQFLLSGRRSRKPAKPTPRSGRPGSPRDTGPARREPAAERREPSLGGSASAPGGGLRADPYFPTATAGRQEPETGLRAPGGRVGAGRR